MDTARDTPSTAFSPSPKAHSQDNSVVILTWSPARIDAVFFSDNDSMKFSIDVYDTEVADLLLDLTKITGIDPWKRRFSWLQRELNENPFMEEWLRERCLIEWTMNEVLANP